MYQAMKPIELLNISETADLLRTSVPTIRWRLCQSRKEQDDFPKPVTGFKKRCLWLRSDVERYILQCSERNNPVRPKQPRQGQHTPETMAMLEKFGMPLSDDGTLSPVAKKIMKRVQVLKKAGVNILQ
jgi:predicted DNA-binding transcriptional regulator AlpA